MLLLMLTLRWVRLCFDFGEIFWVWRVAVNVVWILKPRNYLEVECLFLYGFGFDWGWSDFVPSNFDLFVFKMADSLSRKVYRWNALRANFQKNLEEARGCISNTRATQAKYLRLQNNINRLCKSLNEIDDKNLSNFRTWKYWIWCPRKYEHYGTCARDFIWNNFKLENTGFPHLLKSTQIYSISIFLLKTPRIS